MKKVLLIVWLLLSTVLSVWGYNPDKTLRSMTLREKIAQLFIVTVYKPGITKSQRKLLNKIKPGGIIFLSNKLKDALKVKKTCDILKRLPFGWRLKIPMFLIATASQANIGGPVTAPIVASVYQKSLAPVGLLMAIFGAILGIYAGLFCAQLCYWADKMF